MLLFQRKYRKALAEQRHCSEAEAAFNSLLPEQKKLVTLLGKYVTAEGEALPFDCRSVNQDWQSWQTPAEKLLPEMLYTDTVTQDECGTYRITEFGQMVCKVGMLATPAQ